MTRLLAVIFILLAINVYSQDSVDFKNGVDFIGKGTEPPWEVKIDYEKGIYFSLLADELNLESEAPMLILMSDIMAVSYFANAERHRIKVQISKDTCYDRISDRSYYYSVKVFINNLETRDSFIFAGCGYYLADERLNQKWNLKCFNGVEIKPDEVFKIKPYIEFNTFKNKVNGNAGCNYFFGNAEVRGNQIIFGYGFSSTLMMCDDMEFEREFFNAIIGKILKYKIEDDKLYFYDEENIIMEFNK